MMRNVYTLSMVQPAALIGVLNERVIEADNMTIENGHYVFWQSMVGPVRTVAMSQVLELSTRPNTVDEDQTPMTEQEQLDWLAKHGDTDLEPRDISRG